MSRHPTPSSIERASPRAARNPTPLGARARRNWLSVAFAGSVSIADAVYLSASRRAKGKNMNVVRSLVWALLALVSQIAWADRVVPSNRVETNPKVQAAPSSTAAIVGALEPGDSARVDQSIPHWYAITLDNGTPGFVSKAWSQIVPNPVVPAAAPHY